MTTNPSEADYGLTAAISEAVGPDIKKALLFAELVGDANAPTAWLQIGMTIERGGRLESHEIKGDQLHKIALKIFEDAARNDRSVLFLLAALRENELTISYGFERDVPEGGVPFFIYEAAIEKHFGQPWIVEPSPPPPANQVVQRGLVGEEEYLSVLQDWNDEVEAMGLVPGAPRSKVREVLDDPDVESLTTDVYRFGGQLNITVEYDESGIVKRIKPSRRMQP